MPFKGSTKKHLTTKYAKNITIGIISISFLLVVPKITIILIIPYKLFMYFIMIWCDTVTRYKLSDKFLQNGSRINVSKCALCLFFHHHPANKLNCHE